MTLGYNKTAILYRLKRLSLEIHVDSKKPKTAIFHPKNKLGCSYSNSFKGMIEGNVYPKFGQIWMRNVATSRVVTRKLLKKNENSYYMKRLNTRSPLEKFDTSRKLLNVNFS